MDYYPGQNNFGMEPYPRQQPQRSTGMPEWWPSSQQQNPQPRRPQVQALPGKYINSLQDIVPQDVPTDGSIGIFPQSDYAAIYLKKWDGNGTISTVKYIPDLPPQGPTPEQQFQNDLQTRLAKIEESITYLTSLWQPQSDGKKEEKK